MNKTIRSITQKYRITKVVYDTLRRAYRFHIYVYIQMLRWQIVKFLGLKNNKIRNLKNIFLNQRCFIVCNGPSLSVEDLEKIKKEYCFTMNSVIKALPKTTWRPVLYGIQDTYVYEKIEEEVIKCPAQFTFISKDIVDKKLNYPPNSFVFRLFDFGHDADNPNPIYKFSDDISYGIFDGYSITYSILQIACYLGFKEIYLIGCDCSYSKDPSKQHFSNSGHVDPNSPMMTDKLISGMKAAKKYCDSRGIKIINATRGGALEVFPRISIDDMEL